MADPHDAHPDSRPPFAADPLPPVRIIVARAVNGVIGRDGGMPWHLPADLRRFKTLTMGCPMIMGRKTFDSFPALLPGRRHIVLTRDRQYAPAGAEVVHDRESALALAARGRPDTIWVIGGADIIALFEPVADSVELTEVAGNPAGDTVLPTFDPARWRETARESHEGYSFVTLERAR